MFGYLGAAAYSAWFHCFMFCSEYGPDDSRDFTVTHMTGWSPITDIIFLIRSATPTSARACAASADGPSEVAPGEVNHKAAGPAGAPVPEAPPARAPGEVPVPPPDPPVPPAPRALPPAAAAVPETVLPASSPRD